jgi:hypothetical protein
MMIETATSYPAIDTQTTVDDIARSLQSALDMNSAQQRVIKEQKNKIDNARLAILEAFDNDSFDRENFEVVAEALDISLTKEVNVTINVTFSGTVDVPIGFDIEGNLENYVDFEATASGWGNVDIECDLFTDGVDVNVCER